MADDFDPVQYLQEKQALIANANKGNSFDPQAYLARKLGATVSARPNPDAIESFLRGGEQGATFGFGPQINAALGTAKDVLVNPNTDVGSDYVKQRTESKDAMEAAAKAHPIASGAGNLIGSLAPAVAMGGANLIPEGVGGAAALGAGTGGLNALANSSDSSPEDTIKNVASGALLGGATGGVLGTAAETLAPVGTSIVNSLKGAGSAAMEAVPYAKSLALAAKQGLKGNRIFGNQGLQNAQSALDDELRWAQGKTFMDASSASQNKLASLNENPDAIDMSPHYSDASDIMESARQNNPAPNDQKDIDKIQSLYDAYDNGDTANMPAVMVERLKRSLGQLGTEGESPLNTSTGRALANRLMSPSGHSANLAESGLQLPEDFEPLQDVLNNHIANLDPTNQRIHQLTTALDIIKNPMEQGKISQDNIDDFLQTLPSDTQQNIQPGLQNAFDQYQLAQQTASSGLQHGVASLGKSAVGAAHTMANIGGLSGNAVGSVATAFGKGVTEGPIGQSFRPLYDMAPDQLQTLGQTLMGLPGNAADLGKTLLAASTKDHNAKNALLFTLEQSPVYRHILNRMITPQQK